MRSPCQKLCHIPKNGRLCLGCYRTLEEISLWTRYSDEERNAIMAELATGQRQMTEETKRELAQ